MSARRSSAWLAASVALLAWLPASALAQAEWEYSPYKVQVWLAAPALPQLPPTALDQLSAALIARCDVVFPALWDLQVERAPLAAREELLFDFGELPIERLSVLAPQALASDKLFVVAIRPDDAGWLVQARELDCRTRQWSPAAERPAATLEALPLATWDAMLNCFTPLAKIERVDGAKVVARLRAGGLIVDPASLALAEKGMALRPVLRRNDRTGAPVAKVGIQAVPWTLLHITERQGSLLDCEILSGYRGAIPAKASARSERLALLVRPQFPATTLVVRSRSAPNRPLEGYEIHAKTPGSDDSRLLGATDWQGELVVPRAGSASQLLLIRNGSQLLARLPLVPGQAQRLEAPLVDDDGRLQAEGAIAALHSRALDLVARREILAARFRARLKDQKFEEAQVLLDEFRQLETRNDLSRALNEQQLQARSDDKLTQSRIDKLFSEARKMLLLRQLADDMVNALAAELLSAKAAPKATAATGS